MSADNEFIELSVTIPLRLRRGFWSDIRQWDWADLLDLDPSEAVTGPVTTQPQGESRTNIDLGNGETFQIVVTHEGVIMDHFAGDGTGFEDSLSTVGMTFDEWTEWMAS